MNQKFSKQLNFSLFKIKIINLIKIKKELVNLNRKAVHNQVLYKNP